MNVNERTRGIEVADFERDALGDPQAEGIQNPEAGAPLLATGCRDDVVNLLQSEDVGQLHFLWRPKILERLPVAWDGTAEKEPQGAVGNLQRAGGELTLMTEVKQITAHLRFRERIGRLAIVRSKLTQAVHVDAASAVGEPGEMEVLEELLAKRRHVVLLSERVVSSERASAPRRL